MKTVGKFKEYVQKKREAFGMPERIGLACILLIVALLELYFAYFRPSGDSLAYAEQKGILRYEPGEQLSFKRAGTATPYCVSGFAQSERKFTWTLGDHSKLYFQIDGEHEDLSLDFSYKRVYAPPQRVQVYANGIEIANLTVDDAGSQTVLIPKSCVEDESLILEFVFPDAKSPADLGESIDARKLALAMTKLCISDAA